MTKSGAKVHNIVGYMQILREKRMLSVQEVDDGVGIGAGETVGEDGDAAVGLDGDVTKEKAGTARDGADR